MSAPRLLADIGGTNIRLAWQAAPESPLFDIRSLRCADHPTLEHAVRRYLADVAAPPPVEAALGIANPASGDDEVRMTNHAWVFSKEALRRALGLRRLLVLNDFTALALALPHLPPPLLRQVGGDEPEPGAPVALVGPGTGLGVSGLLFCGNGEALALSGEGGHASLAPDNALEFNVLAAIRARHGHASAERAVSGPGLVEIHRALCVLDGRGDDELLSLPSDVTDRALIKGDPLALQALDMFCAFLGSMAGNLALTLGARGGVFIGGGIVGRLGAWFDHSPFRRRFEAKGRMRAYLEPIPCWVVDPQAQSALMGAAIALDQPARAGA